MNLRLLFVLALDIAMPVSLRSQTEYNRYATDIINDLALVYAGGQQRPDWNSQNVMPYVVHQYSNGDKDWFFDGFLILEFADGPRDLGFQNGVGQNYATRADWDWLIDRQLDGAVAGIDSAIEVSKKQLGTPPFRHRIVMAVPAPIKASGKQWGKLNGKTLDFALENDRLDACRWAIDQIIDRFNRHNYKNVDLAGIYWLEESLYTNGTIVPLVNDYVRSQNLRSYWIPYYADNAQFKFNWRDVYRFDIAYQQPNYFFSRSIPLSQLEAACDESHRYGLGMEMEFETQGTSRVQHDDEDSYYDRLIAYLDMFEEKNVFAESAVAWYSGTKGFIDLYNSTDSCNSAVADRMARIVANRRRAPRSDAGMLSVTDGKLSFTSFTSAGDTVRVDFAKCMANNLFTFSDVFLNGNIVNHTDSDNIGPFGLDSGWTGGNHTNIGKDKRQIRSAYTMTIKAYADGKQIDLAADSVMECNVLTVDVANRLNMPGDTAAFADENVIYTVSGNSVDVRCNHFILQPAMVHRYYGMQSMFCNETDILTPGGAYAGWTPVRDVDRFCKSGADKFSLFVEKSENGYQSTWLDPAVGLGNRDMVDDDDVVFIGNSYTKSYHKTIGNKPVKSGDRLSWHGVYSWFSCPVENSNAHFVYRCNISGSPVVIRASMDGFIDICLVCNVPN